MVFSVYEQGMRINTPWETIFPPRNVGQTTEIAQSPTISTSNLDKQSRHPTEALEAYQRQSQDQEQRERVYNAEQIMSSPAISVKPDTQLDQAWQLFRQHQLRHLPVISSSKLLLGVVSEHDILEATSKLTHPRLASYHHLTIADVMSKRVLTARPDSQIRELAEAMNNFHIGCIPILDNDQAVIGIVTRGDILRTIMHRAPLELWT